VRSVAERHGASVSLATSPLGGLRATVRFAAVPEGATAAAAPALPTLPVVAPAGTTLHQDTTHRGDS
jgi:hypothetical protein